MVSLLTSVFLVLTLTLSACGDDKGGTYYPSNEEMKANLEKEGYIVTLSNDLWTNDLGDETSQNDHKGTLVHATKSHEVNGVETYDFLYFYRLDDARYCEYYYNAMENHLEDYNALVKVENDENLVILYIVERQTQLMQLVLKSLRLRWTYKCSKPYGSHSVLPNFQKSSLCDIA